VNQELLYITENEEYEKYEQTIKRREVAPNTAPPPSPAKTTVQSTTVSSKEVPSAPRPAAPSRPKGDQSNGNSAPTTKESGIFSFVTGIKDSMSSKSNKPDEVVDDLRKLAEETKSGIRKPAVEASIDDFVVEEEGADDWLSDDPPAPSIITKPGSNKPQAEETAADRNPMVNFSDDEEELQFDDYKFESPVKNITQRPSVTTQTKKKQQTKTDSQSEDEDPEPNPLVTEDFGEIDVDFSAPPIVRNVTADSPVKPLNIEKPAAVVPRPSEVIPNVTANVQRPTVTPNAVHPNVSPQKPPPVKSNFDENGGSKGKDMSISKGQVINSSDSRRKNEARSDSSLDSSQEKKSSNVRQVQYEVMDDPEDDPFLTGNPGNPEPDNGKDDNWDFLPSGDFDDDGSSEAFFTALTPTYSNKSQPPPQRKPIARTESAPTTKPQQPDLAGSGDSAESGRGRGGPRGAPAGRMNRGVRVRVRGGGPGRPGPGPGPAPGTAGPGPRGRGPPTRGRAASPPIPTPPDQF
jgi:hypothetical protein